MEREDANDGPRSPSFDAPPEVVGEARMRAQIHERLFGTPESSSGHTDPGSEETLPADERATTSPHGDGGRLDRIPDQIGRFEVLEPVGSGGMGLVLAARDPELDRKVAVKLLRFDRSDPAFSTQGRSRLLREAQAMAKLAHPNVITVHEVGTFEGGVFVAMELVDGQPLSAWIRGEAHPWREVVRVFRDAGEGLAAAHEAGLVHRDFKPENVLMGRDGRVRVLDFGLARSASAPELEAAAPLPAETDDVLATPLTRTGAVLGTPAYMSPEQYAGKPADARSDQFSFCVSLYEGLYGERPFPGKTITELLANITEGRIRSAPADRSVPGWLRGAVLRGLAISPDDRWPDMDGLLDAIDRDPARRWRRIGIIGLVAAGAAGLALAVAPAAEDPAEACKAVAHALDGVWDHDRRTSVKAALGSEGYAAATAHSTAALLDGYADRWTKIAHDACIAAAGASPEEAARVQACLDLHQTELSALVSALDREGAEMLPHAVQAAAALPDPTPCTDPRRRPEMPTDPEGARKLESERAKLARAGIDARMSRHDEAARAAGEVLAAARELGHVSTEAEALFLLGKSRERLGEVEEAEQSLRDAIRRAETAGDDLTRARVMTYLVYVIGRSAGRPQEAYALADQTRDLLRALGANPLVEANLLGNLAAVESSDGKHESALEHHREVLELRQTALGEEHPDTLRAFQSVASVLSQLGQHDEARDMLVATIERAEKLLGRDHPDVLSMVGNLANARARAGALDEAVELQRRAADGSGRAFGADDPRLARPLHNLGRALRQAGRPGEAREVLERALAVREAAVGPDDPGLVRWLAELAHTDMALDDHPAAVEGYQRALLLREKAGATSTELADLRFDLARAMRKAGQDPERAKFLARSAREGFVARDRADRAAAVDAWLAEG